MTGLKRSLGLPTLLFYGIGVIIGAGIYSVMGEVAGIAGRAAWVSLVLAGIPAILTAFCYAELSTRFPRAGAAYVYIREALPQWPTLSFAVGFTVALTAAATAATVAVAFGGYISHFVDIPIWLSALGLLIACTAVNIIGIRESSWVTILSTTIEVIGLFLIIGVGFKTGRLGQGVLEVETWPVLTGAAISFFVFTGFEGLANLTEEAKNPKRDVPLSIIVCLVVTLILYIFVSLAAVALVEPCKLAESDSPLSTAAGAVGPRLAAAMAWIALFSTANTALISVVVGSRLLYGMAEEGAMPPAFQKTLEHRQTPWFAAIVIAVAALIIVPAGGVALIGGISSFGTLVVFFFVGLALLLIRMRNPNESVGFQIPGSIGRVPVIPMLAMIAVVLLLTQFQPGVYVAGIAQLFVGAALYATRRWWGRGNLVANATSA